MREWGHAVLSRFRVPGRFLAASGLNNVEEAADWVPAERREVERLEVQRVQLRWNSEGRRRPVDRANEAWAVSLKRQRILPFLADVARARGVLRPEELEDISFGDHLHELAIPELAAL